MKLSIIIVNWNTQDLLKCCLESIFKHLIRFEFEVWVVDNASTDESMTNIDSFFPQVRLIKNWSNEGFGRANNQAAHLATGDYLLFLNPDTRVFPEAINNLDACPCAAAVGPRLLNADGSLQISAFPAPTLGRELWRLFHLDKIFSIGQYPQSSFVSKPVKVDILMGACILIRAEVFKKIGSFDENFFMYSEEVDLCERIRKSGWELHWIPNAQVTHFGGMSSRQVAEAMFLELYRNKIKFFRKHRGKFQAGLYKVILKAAALTRIIFGQVLCLFLPRDRGRLSSTMNNYQALLSELPRM